MGDRFTLRATQTNRSVRIVNGDKSILAISKPTNRNNFYIQALKPSKKVVTVKVQIGNQTLSCNFKVNCRHHAYNTVGKKVCTRINLDGTKEYKIFETRICEVCGFDAYNVNY